jgi:hypothetical protein
MKEITKMEEIKFNETDGICRYHSDKILFEILSGELKNAARELIIKVEFSEIWETEYRKTSGVTIKKV